MPTESFVQPPPNYSSGPKLDTRTRAIGSDTKHSYKVDTGRLHKIVEASITRPADTTAYASGDQVGSAALEFSAVARAAAESGCIVGAMCIDSVNAGTKPQLELWLFNGAAAPTAVADNAAWTPTDGEVEKVVAVITFTTWYEGLAGASGNAVAPATLINGLATGRAPFVCTTVDDLFGLVVVRNAYAPTASEKFTFRLFIEQD
jgi:hypothetical protein